jgi:hypothetical protein
MNTAHPDMMYTRHVGVVVFSGSRARVRVG